jgi:hypothetical protein
MATRGVPLKYKEEFCEMLMKHMAQGKTFASFALHLFKDHGTKVTRKTLYTWLEKYPEFKEAEDTGKLLSEGWWDDKTQDGIGGGQLNAALISLIRVNRHNHRTKAKDEVETIVNNTNNFAPEKISQEELEKKLAEHFKRKGLVK